MNKLMSLWHELTRFKEDVPYAAVREDFHRRYLDTYMIMQLKDNKPPFVAYIRPLLNSGSLSYYRKAEEFTVKEEDILSLKPWLPKKGYYAHGTQVVFLKRKSSRQWKRSFCQSTHHWTTELLVANFYNNKPRSFPLDTLDIDSPAIILTPSMATGYNQKQNIVEIKWNEDPIGYIEFFTRTIHLQIPELKQEVLDYLKSTNQMHWTINESKQS